MKIGLKIAGYLGLEFLRELDTDIKWVMSYSNYTCSAEKIEALCKHRKIKFHNLDNEPENSFAESIVDKIFVVGWQFILHRKLEKTVVFHDSLLPKYRGWSPTVTAIINNDTLGVTAFRPTEAMDEGDIYRQKKIYPLSNKLADVYHSTVQAYVSIAEDIMMRRNAKIHPQKGTPSYSIWRDYEDFYIDWSWDAEKIKRKIDALSFPYSGAKATYKGEVINVLQAIVDRDKKFVERHPGKIFNINSLGMPSVVCGKGMIRIAKATDGKGENVNFDILKQRLG